MNYLLPGASTGLRRAARGGYSPTVRETWPAAPRTQLLGDFLGSLETNLQSLIKGTKLRRQVSPAEKTLSRARKPSGYFRLISTGRSSLKSNESRDRKSTRLNSSHVAISYAVFCLKKKKKNIPTRIAYTTPPSPAKT